MAGPNWGDRRTKGTEIDQPPQEVHRRGEFRACPATEPAPADRARAAQADRARADRPCSKGHVAMLGNGLKVLKLTGA